MKEGIISSRMSNVLKRFYMIQNTPSKTIKKVMQL